MARAQCTGPECDRPQMARGVCKGHYRQLRAGRELYVIGSRGQLAKSQKAYWASLSPDEKAARVQAMHAALRGKERTAEHRAHLSEAHKARWQQGMGPPKDPRVCWGCEVTFQPKSGNHFYCTLQCQRVSIRLRSKYGLTIADYKAMFDGQGGKCALCREAWQGWSYIDKLHVDHCHKTGKVRGLLCGDCNTALGRFGDDPERLRAAIAYLERVADEEASGPDVAEASSAA